MRPVSADAGVGSIQGRLRDLNRALSAETEAFQMSLGQLAEALETSLREDEALNEARRQRRREERKVARRLAKTKVRALRERRVRWQLATEIYADLEALRERLAALSRKLVDRFEAELSETRAFNDRQALADRLEADFVTALCGDRAALREYLDSLLARKAWAAVGAFTRYVEAIGPDIDVARLSARLEEQFALPVQAWAPMERMLAERYPLADAMIRRVETVAGQGGDLLGRLRASGLGRFYVEHLKRHPAIRKRVIWLWQNGYPIYVNKVAPRLFRRESERWRPLVDLAQYVTRRDVAPPLRLAAPATVMTPVPVAYPEKHRPILVSPHDEYVFPDIFVATIPNGSVYGGTNLVLAGDEVVHHNLYDFTRDYTSEELHGRTAHEPRRGRIRWLVRDPEPEHMEEAATFVDACASNYAHWLTEVLTRVVLFCGEARYAGVPIIVNDGLHRNLLESLQLVTQGTRRIVTLPIGRAVTVERLYFTSNAGYVPFDRRPGRLGGHSHGRFSPDAFGRMREVLTDAIRALPSPAWPKKVYLRRNSGARKVVNASEIEHALVARGYAVIEPEKLSFIQQVQLFSQVEAVVASTGAAVANIVFCPPGTHISIFISCYADTSYWYWQNIAAASGNVVRYVLGEAAVGGGQGIHADFHVDVHDVIQSL